MASRFDEVEQPRLATTSALRYFERAENHNDFAKATLFLDSVPGGSCRRRVYACSPLLRYGGLQERRCKRQDPEVGKQR